MLDLLLDEDEVMITETVRDYLARELPIERLRPKAIASDLARARAAMFELGWFRIGLPESVGGAGLGLVEEMLIQRECGRYLVGPWVLATVLGAHVAYQAGDLALAREVGSGNASVALAIPAAAHANADRVATCVFDWSEGDALLVCNDEGVGLFDASTFTEVRLDKCLDDSVGMHAGVLAMREPRYWVTARQAPLVLQASVLFAAALVGLAERACDLAVDYAKVREQFGKPIGSFQAVKHRCADMAVRARLAWYQTNLACLKVHGAAADAVLQSAAAKLLAAQAAHENGRAAIQLHGGIGFQAECDAHWFMKRAYLYDQAGGSMQQQAQRVVAQPSPLW